MSNLMDRPMLSRLEDPSEAELSSESRRLPVWLAVLIAAGLALTSILSVAVFALTVRLLVWAVLS